MEHTSQSTVIAQSLKSTSSEQLAKFFTNPYDTG